MTPRIVSLLMKHNQRLLHIADLQNGMIASTIANFGAYPPKKPFAPRDFLVLPSYAPPGIFEPEPKVDLAEKLKKLFGRS